MYRGQDLNLHAVQHLVLSQACLPVPSPRPVQILVAEDGIEPPTFGLWARRDTVSLLRNDAMAGELGFEPRQTESESGVLPLDDSPITKEDWLGNQDSNLDKRSQSPVSYR